MSEKVYKKGETVYIWCCTHDAQSLEYEKLILEDDMTEMDLEDWAE